MSNENRRLIQRFLLASSAILFTLTSAAGQGINIDYLPFSKDLVRTLPLKRTALAGELREGKPIIISGVQIQEQARMGRNGSSGDDRQLVFSGLDLRGKKWRLKTEASIYYDAVYEGDLDRNGVRDLVISIATGGNGLAP